MTDLLVYWRDYQRNVAAADLHTPLRRWHSSSRYFAALEAGNRLWLVTSGDGLGLLPRHAAFLVGVWRIERLCENPGDDPAYPTDRYRYRALATDSTVPAARLPVCVDEIVRPRGSAEQVPIGRLLQGPRRLSAETIARLEAVLTDSQTSRRSVLHPAASDVNCDEPLDRDRIALGVRYPWAELILRGIKTIEVRTLPTRVRGPIYLYSSQTIADTPVAQRLSEQHQIHGEALPQGRLIGSVEIIDCRPGGPQDAAGACLPASALAGKFAWELAHPRRLSEPVRPRFLPYGVWFYPFRRRKEESNS